MWCDIATSAIYCAPERDIPRTWDPILYKLTKLNTVGDLPDLSVVSVFQKHFKETKKKKKWWKFAGRGK